MAILNIRSKLSARAAARGTLSILRKRDIEDVLPSQIVEQQFPEFIRSDYPKMVDFAKAYFNFLEQTENGKIDDIKDLDRTSGDYIIRMRNEFAFNSTEFDFLEDKEFIRYAKYFYSSKGTEESIKFLFRVMFDEAVEIEYPSESIFKPSSARWFQEQSVKVTIELNSIPPTFFIGNYLRIRNSSGAEQTIEVSNVTDITEKAAEDDLSTLFEIFFTTELLIPVSIGDTVFGTDFESTIIPSLSSVTVISPGNNFRVGQVIELDSITGAGGIAVITNVRTDGAIKNIKLLRFGKNYTTNFYLGIVPEGVFTDAGASFSTTGTATFNKAIEDITEGFVERQTILRSDYVLNNSPVSGSSPFSNYVYSSYTGVYVSQLSNRQVFFLEEDYSALLLGRIGAVCKYPGKFLDQTGMPSNSSVLQDNNVYQDFSYVVKTTSDISEYKETITTLAHPAGFKMFGELSIGNEFDSETTLTGTDIVTDLRVTDFDFTTGTLDGRITVSRNSIATYYNSTGLLKTAAVDTPRSYYDPVTLAAQGVLIEEGRTNLLTYSEQFDNAVWVKSGSTITANSGTSPTGSVNAFRLSMANSSQTPYQPYIFVNGVSYTFSCFVKRATGTDQIFRLGKFQTSTVYSSNYTANDQWQRFTHTFIGDGSTSSPSVFFVTGSAGAAADILIWGAQLEVGSFPTSYIPSNTTFTSRASVGTYFDSTGTLQTASANVARNTYNPQNLLADPYLLLEEARTNSIRNNTMVGAVAGTPGTLPTNWSVAAGGLTANVIGTGTESGINYIDIQLVGTTASTSAGIRFEPTNQTSAASGQSWSGSFYTRIVSGSITNISDIRVNIFGRTAANASNTDNSSGADLKASLTAASLSQVRRTHSSSLADATTAFVSTQLLFGFASGAAIDITLRIGLPQLEQGAYSTSVIKTTTTALPRSADISASAARTRPIDILKITGSNFNTWFNNTNGTVYFEGTTFDTFPTSFPRAFQVSNGTANNFMQVTRQTATGRGRISVIDGGVTQVAADATVWNLNAITKAALSYSANNFAISVNGGAVISDLAGTVPAVTQMTIGSDYALGSALNGFIRRLTYYPVQKSNLELLTLTATGTINTSTQDYSFDADFIGDTISIGL